MPAAFVERVQRLLGTEPRALPENTQRPVRAPISAEPTPAPPLAPAPGTAQGFGVSRRSKFAWAVLAAAGILAIGYFAFTRLSPRKPTAELALGAATTPTDSASAANSIPEKSIAVLPFVDMSEKRDQEYFSDGLTEELLDLLSQVPDLFVPARTSSFYFKGKSEDIAVIAQKLHVAHLLEGSVRKAGNTIRVTAQLIRADNGYHLWSQTYDRDLKDVFKVQDEIAAAVVEALKAKLLPTQGLASRHQTQNTEAYTQYLLGNQYRLRDDKDGNRLALAAYQKAIALDPSYAPAYSGVSDAEWRIADQITGEAAAYKRAAAAADRAIALAPESPEGYWARGQLRSSYYFDWNGAQADLAKALSLDPNFVRAKVDQSLLMATLGRMQEGINILNEALKLDPLSVLAQRRLAFLLMHDGQFAEARQAIQRAVAINPQGDQLAYAGQIEILAGRPQAALAGLPADATIVREMAEYQLGHAAEAQRLLDDITTHQGNVWGYQIAQIYALRGDKTKALDWLERSYDNHDAGLTYITYDRYLMPLRREPRFQLLLRKLKLAAPAGGK